MIRNKYIAFVMFVIIFLALWNLADYLYATLITNETYHFAAGSDGVIPAAVAIVSGYLIFIRNN